MRYQDIAVGDTLRLKKARQEAYALPNRDLPVVSITERRGYKVPWINCQSDPFNVGSFRPEDFERRVSS